MDIVDRKTRSKIMSAIRSRGNKTTELRMGFLLRKNGLTGWRKHQPIFGKPDFAWSKKKVALFVDGCFWHGCLRCRRAPKSNKLFWGKKIKQNAQRDRRVAEFLRKDGWHVIRVRECKIANFETVARIRRFLL